MARQNERMVPNTFSLTPAQTTDLDAEAKRRGVSRGEVVRRIFEEWRDKLKSTAGGLAGKMYQER